MTGIIKDKKMHMFSIKDFKRLMSDEKISLPILVSDDYDNTLVELFDYYCEKLTFLTLKQRNAIRLICNNILEIINSENEEQFEKFEKFIQLDIVKKNLRIIKKEMPVDGYGKTRVNLFKLRQTNLSKKYKREEIFHVPYTKNTKMTTTLYRYNIEKKPSLYLGSTVQCCMSELGIDVNEKSVIGSMYRLNEEKSHELYIIDIGKRPIDFIKRTALINDDYQPISYLFIYPLIAACSVVVKDKDVPNIPEYEISNLLYQWINKYYNHQLCGIRYFSCADPFYKIRDNKGNIIYETDSKMSFTRYYINYAFPIGKNIDSHGYSEKLKEAFVLTLPRYYKEFENIIYFENKMKTLKLEKVK